MNGVLAMVVVFGGVALAQNCASTDPGVHLTQEDCDRILPQLSAASQLESCKLEIKRTDRYVAALKEQVAAYKHLADVYNKALCSTVAALGTGKLPEYCTNPPIKKKATK